MTRKLIIEDAQGTSEFELLGARTVVGREEDCDLRLDSRKVSRRHLRIAAIDDTLVADDLGSANGTLLNGEPLEGPAPLEVGDRLQVGDFVLHVDEVRRVGSARPVGAVEEARRRADARRSRTNAPVIVAATAVLVGLVGWMLLRGGHETPADEGPAPSRNGTADAGTADRAPEPRPMDEERRRHVRARAEALASIRLEVEQFLLQDDFRGAEAALERFAEEFGRPPVAVRRLYDEAVEGFASRSIAEFRGHLAEGRDTLARGVLEARISLLPETSAAAESLRTLAAARRSMAGEPAAPTAEAPADDEPAPTRRGAGTEPGAPPGDEPTTARPDETTLALTRGVLEAARDAWRRDWETGRYLAAARIADRLIAQAREHRMENLLTVEDRARAGLARRVASLSEALAAAISADPAAAGSLELGGSARGLARRADAEGIVAATDEGETLVSWDELPPATWLILAQRLPLGPEDRLGAAALALADGKTERGQKILREVEHARPELEPEVDRVLAEALGTELPEGGFIWFDGRYVTTKDVQRASLKAVVETNVARLGDADSATRAEAYASLRAFGARAASAYHRGLLAAKEALLAKVAGMKGQAALAKLAGLKTELDARREHALELIFDEYEYPYPYNGIPDAAARHSRANQEIDARVARIREIWDDGTKATITPELRTALRILGEYDRELEHIGIGAGPPTPAHLQHVPTDRDVVTIRDIADDAAERERIDVSRAWMALDAERESAATDAERKQVRITNEYRVMMGRHAVRLNERLLDAARMHSEDMSRDGFFSHQNPNDPRKRSPSDRMRWVGFYGVGASENIAATGGSPMGAHVAWLHSSGHHRNILGKGWRLLGSGNSGRNWTQNFAVKELSDEERESRGLPAGGLRELETSED